MPILSTLDGGDEGLGGIKIDSVSFKGAVGDKIEFSVDHSDRIHISVDGYSALFSGSSNVADVNRHNHRP